MHRLLLVALALGACRDDVTPEKTIQVASYAAIPARQLDILVQIDDSASTDNLHRSLGRSFGGLLDSLATIDGGLPDLHVGVITSDMGTSNTSGPPGPSLGTLGQGGCADVGDDGVLQLSGAPVTDAFLVDEDDGGLRRRNYTGALVDVLARMFVVGTGGCGFEQPLAATMRAFTNNANVGFSRPDANLLVLIIADEDDCSLRDAAILGPEDAELGPLQSFRCARFGLACAEPLDSIGPKTDCRPREDSPYIEGVAPFVDFMRLVRGDTARVAVAAIVGPPDISVEERAPPSGPPQLGLAHSCSWSTATGPAVADPALRVAAAIDALGPNATNASVCSDNLDGAIADVSRVARGLYGITCLDSERILDTSSSPGLQPACSVVVESAAGETPLSLCPAAGDCFELVDDPAACPGRDTRLVVNLVDPQPDQYVRARCVAN